LIVALNAPESLISANGERVSYDASRRAVAVEAGASTKS
jgi:hypothetical protein